MSIFAAALTLQHNNIMKIHNAQWYEVKIRTSEQTDDGAMKDKTTPYVVEAYSFSDAEDVAIKEASDYTSGSIDVADIKKARYIEIYFSDDTTDDRWYKTTLQFVTVNEKSGKEKVINSHHLVQASSLQKAVKNIEEVMKGSMQDYTIANIAETAFLDVIVKLATGQNSEEDE